MTIELNIRLDVVGRRFTDEQFARRSKTIVGLLGKFGTVDHRVRRIWIDQPRHLVAQVHTDEISDVKLFKLAERFQQGCISVYCPTRNEGHLVGPKADAWGDFNLEKFERFDDSLSLRNILAARKRYRPPSDPAVLQAQIDAARARYRLVFTDEVLASLEPQQRTLALNAINRDLAQHGAEGLTVPYFEGMYELVTEHLWCSALTSVAKSLEGVDR